MEKEQMKPILEAVLMASSNPLTVDALLKIFPETEQPEKADLEEALAELEADCEGRSFELKKVSSGYRFQVRKDYADYVTKLWEEKPARYSRALLETLSLIAYRQPITRGEIEAVRGVSVSSHIIKTLHERDWIKVVGHRDVPGKPSLYATTKEFLDYFNLASLDDLPSLQEIRDIDQINAELDLRLPDAVNEGAKVEQAGNEQDASESESELTAGESVTEESADSQLAETDQNSDVELASAESDTEEASGDSSEETTDDESEVGVISLATAEDETETVEDAGETVRDDENNNSSYEATPASAEN